MRPQEWTLTQRTGLLIRSGRLEPDMHRRKVHVKTEEEEALEEAKLISDVQPPEPRGHTLLLFIPPSPHQWYLSQQP